MCGGFPNSTTRGKPLPPVTLRGLLWGWIKKRWRAITRPLHESKK
jgi:hypothetical protein